MVTKSNFFFWEVVSGLYRLTGEQLIGRFATQSEGDRDLGVDAVAGCLLLKAADGSPIGGHLVQIDYGHHCLDLRHRKLPALQEISLLVWGFPAITLNGQACTPSQAD